MERKHKINLLELLYEEKPTTTEIVEYGTKLSELMAGKPPGPEGAHFDLHLSKVPVIRCLETSRVRLDSKVRINFILPPKSMHGLIPQLE